MHYVHLRKGKNFDCKLLRFTIKTTLFVAHYFYESQV